MPPGAPRAPTEIELDQYEQGPCPKIIVEGRMIRRPRPDATGREIRCTISIEDLIQTLPHAALHDRLTKIR